MKLSNIKKNMVKKVTDLCGYCRISDKLIPAGIQIAQEERKKDC